MDRLQGVGGLSQHRPQPKSFPARGLVGQWPGPEVPRVYTLRLQASGKAELSAPLPGVWSAGPTRGVELSQR